MRLLSISCALVLLLAGRLPAAADACDGLTVRLIRTTGASLAGRSGSLVVFRAADAERMSLDCRTPRRMLFASLQREPQGAYFILIGLAAQALAGARAVEVETLARQLNQETLLTGTTRQGRAGPVWLRCQPGDRADGFSEGALCRLAPASPPRRSRLPAVAAKG